MYKTTKPITSGRNGIQKAKGIAVVNGNQVRFDSFSVEQNGFSAADSFTLTLPFFVKDIQSGETILANGPDFESVLIDTDSITVALYVGFTDKASPSTSDLTQLMDGTMDTAEWTFDRTGGEKVTLHGRNAVGKMLDTKITEKYPNLTASAIATQIANNHSLTPVVTATTTLAGTYYNQQGCTLGRETSEWDLLLYLAKQENYLVRVNGTKLLFGTYDTVTNYVTGSSVAGMEYDATYECWVMPYTWGYDIETLRIERSPHAARNIVVEVITYDKNKKHRIVEKATSTTNQSTKIADQIGEREKYTVTKVIPGLTRAQAQNMAQQILDQLSRTQLIGQMTCAGNTSMAIDRQIELYGVGLGLSQPYYLNRVEHQFSLQTGYQIDASFSSQFYYS